MSAKKHVRVYLEDILDAIKQIQLYTVGGREKFLADEKTQDAVIYNLAIIGEAANRLPKSLKDDYSGINWKEAIGQRNIVIHEYSMVRLEIIWDGGFTPQMHHWSMVK